MIWIELDLAAHEVEEEQTASLYAALPARFAIGIISR